MKYLYPGFTEQAAEKIKDLEEKIRCYEDELSKQQLKHDFELEVTQRAKESLERDRKQLESKLSVSEEENSALKKTIAKMTADSMGITMELQATKVGATLQLTCLTTLNGRVWNWRSSFFGTNEGLTQEGSAIITNLLS